MRRSPRRSSRRSRGPGDRWRWRRRSSPGSSPAGPASRPSGWASRSTAARPKHSLPRSASAPSACCESSRSWRWRWRIRRPAARHARSAKRRCCGCARVHRSSAATSWPTRCLEGDRSRRPGTARSPCGPRGSRFPASSTRSPAGSRDGVVVADRLAAGEAPAQIKDSLRPMPPRAAERFIAAVRRATRPACGRPWGCSPTSSSTPAVARRCRPRARCRERPRGGLAGAAAVEAIAS